MRKHVEESVATGVAAGRGRGGRFSAGRKREVVLRLLRGEDLETPTPPRGHPPEQVATLPIELATAVHGLKGIGEITAGDKVLIHAGASGSGSMQIQVAKALGASVVTTIRDEAKRDFVKSVGADLIINTTQDDLIPLTKEWTGGRGADVVVDNLGGDVLAKSIEAVKPTGIVVAFGFTAGPQVSFDIRRLFFAQKQLRGSMASDLEDLQWGLEHSTIPIRVVHRCPLPAARRRRLGLRARRRPRPVQRRSGPNRTCSRLRPFPLGALRTPRISGGAAIA